MKALSIRAWFLLLLLAMVATPILAAAIVFAVHPPGPPERTMPPLRITPELATAIDHNVDRWSDPAWQASLTPLLDAGDVDLVLLDPAGRVVYRSPGAAPVNASNRDALAAARPAALLSVPAPAGTATAMLVARPAASLPPLPPWRRGIDFWLIPAVQVAALLAIAVAVALFVSRAFLRPLATMIDGMRQIESGNLDIRLPTSRVAEVAEVAAAFGAMADALRRSLERQDELEQERRMTVSAVIHDLRTPLFALRGYLEGLDAGIADSPEKAARYLQLARDKADALDRLVTDLFAFARTEYLEEAPRRERLDLGELLTRTVEGLEPRAEAKEVRLRTAGTAGPCFVEGDPHLLTRAVENLLDNAVRYTPAGGDVVVAWECAGDEARFHVADNGPGIPPADLPHIFTPLYRGESSRNRRTGGTGLGLAIARRLIRAHGGDLTAANADHGAIFQARLPGLPAAPNVGAAPIAPTPTQVGAPAAG